MGEDGTDRGESLINLFQAASCDLIDWRGLRVQRSFRLRVAADTLLEISFVRAVDDPVQGLAIAATAASLAIAGVSGSRMILWRDTAPDRQLVKISPQSEQAEIVFWNEWRLTDGTVESNWGNAGILVEDEGNLVRLRCSDGTGDADFDDFVIELRILGGHGGIEPVGRRGRASPRARR